MESITQPKDKMATREEMRRKLQEMRMKYDKMQRKLLKSERRKSARNHVRKVLAEQANATSPHLLCYNIQGTCEGITSVARDVSEDSVEAEVLSKSGKVREGRKQVLQRSISFRLEETFGENKTEKTNCERETYSVKRKVGPKKVGMDLTSCLKRENLAHCEDCGRDEEKLKVLRESKLSDCKTTNSTRSGDEHWNSADTDRHSKTCVDQTSVAREPSIKQDGLCVEPQGFVKPQQRNPAKEVSGYASQISDNDVDNRVRLRWRGTFKKQDIHRDLSWNGVCLHQLESNLLLVLYHYQLAVLWMYTDQWEAQRQWQPEEGKNITDVVLGGDAAQEVIVLFVMTDGTTNTLSLLKCNLESGAEEAEDINLPDILREAEELKTVLHRDGGGVVMQKTSTFLSDFFFFQGAQPSQLWQPEGLIRKSAVSFIPVMGVSNLFLSLSVNTLSLWMPAGRIPLIDIALDKLPDAQVDEILWADTGGGILFFIGLKHTSILSLYALNPVTARILKVHTFLQPCAYDSQRVTDTSINGQFLVAMYSSKKLLIWDIYSGRAVAEMSPPNDEIHQLSGIANFLVLNGKDANLFEYTTMH